MGQNNYSEQFQNILRTGDARKLQNYVNANKAQLHNWMGQQQGSWSKLPNYQAANSSWTNFHRGSGSAEDFSNLQRFFKVTPQDSQARQQNYKGGDKNLDRGHGAEESRSPGEQKNRDEQCGNNDNCKKIVYDKNQKNKKKAA